MPALDYLFDALNSPSSAPAGASLIDDTRYSAFAPAMRINCAF